MDVGLFVLLGFLALAAFVVFYSIYQRKQTEKRFVQIAQELGFSYLPRDVGGSGSGFAASTLGRNLLSRGMGDRIEILDVLEGDLKGRHWKFYTLQETRVSYRSPTYSRGKGRQNTPQREEHTTQKPILEITSPKLKLPYFTLGPEFWFSRIGDAIASKFGGGEIDFESDPDFSSSFQLKGPDSETLRSLFSPNVRQAFLHVKSYNFAFEAGGSTLKVQAIKSWDPAEIKTIIAQIEGVVEALEQETFKEGDGGGDVPPSPAQ
ncbi:hypothetical protein D6783_05235 [Candidatus Woesearchaeota archaeon]|nr:MAG: hypothetical protein D6783_05235 [Candidatus Woesearchaeota archaeon]